MCIRFYQILKHAAFSIRFLGLCPFRDSRLVSHERKQPPGKKLRVDRLSFKDFGLTTGLLPLLRLRLQEMQDWFRNFTLSSFPPTFISKFLTFLLQELVWTLETGHYKLHLLLRSITFGFEAAASEFSSLPRTVRVHLNAAVYLYTVAQGSLIFSTKRRCGCRSEDLTTETD